MSVIFFILVISFLVIIHELGHFIAAKWAKVKVDEFGIGYPPKAIKLFHWRGTDFTINWVPFGGFVRMQGEEEYLSEKSNSKKHQFYQATVIQKLVIILAGASVNFLFGVIAFAIVFSKIGIPHVVDEARIGEIAPDSPAQQAGILENSNIVGIQFADQEMIEVGTPQDVIDQVAGHKGEIAKIFTTGVCEAKSCDETRNEFDVYLRTDEEIPENQGSLGVVFDQVVYIFYPPLEMPFRSVVYGLEEAMYLGKQIVQTFSGLIGNLLTQGKISDQIAGPVGIVHQAEVIGIFDQGFLMVLSFAGMLSINLAVMNVLPIPPLDGGRAVFVLLQLILKKERLEKIEYYINYGGYIFFIGLIVFITIKDVLRIFGR